MNRDDKGTPEEPPRPPGDPYADLPDTEEHTAERASAYGNVYRRPDRFSDYDDQESEPYTPPQEDESLRRQLAQFAFVREEDDREVRLTFRDVPAHEIAKTFRASGAFLISMTGERATSRSAVAQRAAPDEATAAIAPEEAEAAVTSARRSHKARKLRAEQDDATYPDYDTPTLPPRRRHTGELIMRYFFSLRETVYTVNIASPTGIVESIANVYPSASLSERELQARLAVLFRETAN